MKINTYIMTCDKTSWILDSTLHLFNKYWNLPTEIKIMGFSKPKLKSKYDNEFISISNEQTSIDDWSKDVLSVIGKDKNEFLVFTLDDFLPNDYTNSDIFNHYIELMRGDSDIVRCALGSYIQHHKHRVIETFDDFNVIEIDQNAKYRLSAQPSIWRRDYFEYWLSRSKSPWHFETAVSPSDGKRILGSTRKYAFNYVIESALSGGRHGDMVNILGLKHADIQELIDLGFVSENKLQYGIHVGKVPQYIDYKNNFTVDVLKSFVDENRYKRYDFRYGQIYK